jgi:predicted nucleotidyltransferase
VKTDDRHEEPVSPLPPGLQSLLANVLADLSTLSVPHCLIGAAALGAWGRPRATHDLDLLLLVDQAAKERLIARLSSSGITVNHRWQAANPMAETRVTRFVSQRHPDYPLDLIYASDRHEREALTRTRSVQLHGLLVSVVSPEDLMILKLKAGRPTDFDDVISIVKNPRLHLDLPYLWNWADRLGLQGELHYVLRAAGAES